MLGLLQNLNPKSESSDEGNAQGLPWQICFKDETVIKATSCHQHSQISSNPMYQFNKPLLRRTIATPVSFLKPLHTVSHPSTVHLPHQHALPSPHSPPLPLIISPQPGPIPQPVCPPSISAQTYKNLFLSLGASRSFFIPQILKEFALTKYAVPAERLADDSAKMCEISESGYLAF
jgi:hypothetical protein